MDDSTKKISIKDWAEEDRPREKLMLKGVGALSDAELLAILIGSGNAQESAVELCRRILRECADNDLNNLGKKAVAELITFKGIGEAKAITIVAALELGRRRRAAEARVRTTITSSGEVAEIMQQHLADLPHEEFWVLFLNRANNIILKERISQGGIAATIADVKIILKRAVETLASGIILCHNHPSGNLTPSQADIQLTNQLTAAAKLLDTKVLDHLIITDGGYYSFADEGKLRND